MRYSLDAGLLREVKTKLWKDCFQEIKCEEKNQQWSGWFYFHRKTVLLAIWWIKLSSFRMRVNWEKVGIFSAPPPIKSIRKATMDWMFIICPALCYILSLPHFISFSTNEVGHYPHFKLWGNLRFREGKQLTQGYTARKWKNQYLNRSICLYNLYSDHAVVRFICLVSSLVCIWQTQLSECIIHFMFGATKITRYHPH